MPSVAFLRRSMRLALLGLLLLGACAPRVPATTTDWADLADVLSAEEYAATFVDELATRLRALDAPLSGEQRPALQDVLEDGAETQRTVLVRYRAAGSDQQPGLITTLVEAGARTDAAAEALLAPAQVPAYRALQTEARVLLAREAAAH